MRTARRLADELNAEWFALYVETPGHANARAAERPRAPARNLRLAEELGAKVVTLPGSSTSVAETILDYARAAQHHQDHGRQAAAPRWHELLRGSVVDQLIRNSGQIDVYVISGDAQTAAAARLRPLAAPPPAGGATWRGLLVVALPRRSAPLRSSLLLPTNLVMLYLVAVVIAAVYLGRGPAILASIAGRAGLRLLFCQSALFHLFRSRYRISADLRRPAAGGLVISNLAARARAGRSRPRPRGRDRQACTSSAAT